MIQSVAVDFVRHGATELAAAFNGGNDVPLDASLRASNLQRLIAISNHWDSIITSPLSRCHDDATALAHSLGIELSIWQDFSEYDFGDWNGLTYDQINAQWPTELTQFYSDPIAHPPPRGETYAAFTQRLDRALNSLGELNTNVGVITHAGVMRSVAARIGGGSWKHSLNLEIGHLARLRTHLWRSDPLSWSIYALEQNTTAD